MSHIAGLMQRLDSVLLAKPFRILAFTVVCLLLLLAGWAASLRWVEARARTVSEEAAVQTAHAQAGLLSSELQKYRLLPLVLTEYPDVAAILEDDQPDSALRLNPKLETLAQRTNAAVIYIIRLDGRTIAASNWRLPTSFVGRDYSYRPYVREALRNGAAELYALGAVSGRPGLFIAQRVTRNGRALGVIVVKVEFQDLETVWARRAGPTFVTDENGVIIITSRPEWRFHTSRLLAAPALARLRATRQYDDHSLSPLHFPMAERGTLSVADGWQPRYFPVAVPFDMKGAELHYLQPMEPALDAARTTARVTVVAGVAVIALILAFLLRVREKALLQTRVRAELEREVALRTAELTEANALLHKESREREQANQRLQSARDELAQANRLGYIGQITSSVAHEINQPVAAIRTFAENAREFLARSRPAQVLSNLDIIIDLTERIGSITAELRSFSRRGTRRVEPVPINDVVGGALLLIGDHLRASGITLKRVGHDLAVHVIADRCRLEQVLINLMQNAAEALEGSVEPCIILSTTAVDRTVIVEVADNGPGIPAALRDEIFQPFITGRADGLGLGLSIARDIAREFGGDVILAQSSADGTIFRLRLAQA